LNKMSSVYERRCFLAPRKLAVAEYLLEPSI
jgi:hypothetical protein